VRTHADNPLRRQLEQLGARYGGRIRTEPGREGSIEGELFRISEAGLGRLLATLPGSAAVASVQLENGCAAIGLSVSNEH
jgi:allophanate hydrolase